MKAHKPVLSIFEDTRVRFLFVGVLNTALGYGLYALCILLGMHYAAAQLVSTVVAVIHSYLWNKYFTFRVPERSASEILRFIGVYAVSYVLNVGFLYLCITVLKISPYLAGALGIFIITLCSYFGHKIISFRVASGERP